MDQLWSEFSRRIIWQWNSLRKSNLVSLVEILQEFQYECLQNYLHFLKFLEETASARVTGCVCFTILHSTSLVWLLEEHMAAEFLKNSCRNSTPIFHSHFWPSMWYLARYRDRRDRYTKLVIVVRHPPNLERICGFPLNNLFSQAQNSISTYSCMQDVTCFSKQVHLCVILYRSADIPFSNFSCVYLNPNSFFQFEL